MPNRDIDSFDSLSRRLIAVELRTEIFSEKLDEMYSILTKLHHILDSLPSNFGLTIKNMADSHIRNSAEIFAILKFLPTLMFVLAKTEATLSRVKENSCLSILNGDAADVARHELNDMFGRKTLTLSGDDEDAFREAFDLALEKIESGVSKYITEL